MADNDNIEELDGPEALRKAYDRLKQQLKAAEDEAKTLKAEKRTSTVSDILKAKGAPAKAAKFYDGEADEASVVAWLKENEDLFPTTDPSASTNSGDDANLSAAQRLADATAGNGDDEIRPLGAQRTVTDVGEIERLLKNTPRTPEGYATLVAAGIMPADPNRL